MKIDTYLLNAWKLHKNADFFPVIDREIKEIIVHCTDSKWGSLEEIRKWHTYPQPLTQGRFMYLGKEYKDEKSLPETVQGKRGRGWNDIGYHFLITGEFTFYNQLKDGMINHKNNGRIYVGRPLEEVGAHCKGQNSHSIGIALVGVSKADMSVEQFISLRTLCLACMMKYKLSPFDVYGHRYYNREKRCPGFSTKKEIVMYLKKLLEEYQGKIRDALVSDDLMKVIEENIKAMPDQ